MRALPALCVTVTVAFAACDPIGRENGRVSAVPAVAPPRLSPVELVPPRVDRSPTARVKLIDPPLADAIQIDVIAQADGVVDILWVIDDSGSMVDERKQLVANFDRFVQELVNLDVDFQMGVTSIIFSDGGQLRGATKIIKRSTPDPRSVFEANTTFPVNRSRWEQGLRMAQFALTPPATDPGGPNAGFIRPKAALAIIVVTNEDDHSFGTTDYYARVFSGLKGQGNEKLVTFSIIGGPTPNGCVPPAEVGLLGSQAEAAFRYADVAGKVGGVIGSICDTSFEQTLLRIAQALQTLKRVFPLTLVPISGTVLVTVVNGTTSTVIPDDLATGYQYDAATNSVVFRGAYVPPPGSKVQIQYAYKKV